jgi:hypothetical protein
MTIGVAWGVLTLRLGPAPPARLLTKWLALALPQMYVMLR